MTKIVKSPKKQSTKITKLKMRVGEIANMLLQNNPKMVRMRSGGSSGYADLFMSKQLMKGGMSEQKRNEIVEFLNKDETVQAVKALKTDVITYLENKEDIEGIGDKKALISELNNDNVYDHNLCDKYNDDTVGELQENLITLDIVNKFYNLVKDKIDTNGISLLPKYPSVKRKNAAAIKIQSLGRRYMERRLRRDILHSNSRVIPNLEEFVNEFLSKDPRKLENIDKEKKDVVRKVVGYLDYIFVQISSKIYDILGLKLLVLNKKYNNYELIEGQDNILTVTQLATLNNIIRGDDTIDVIFEKYYTRNDDNYLIDPSKINSYSLTNIDEDLKALIQYITNIPALLNDLNPIQVILEKKQPDEVKQAEPGEKARLETFQEEDEKDEEDDLLGGRKPTKYKSTGNAVYIMYKKKKYKRTIYVKDRRNTKYCKIDGEYILLSKMKMIA